MVKQRRRNEDEAKKLYEKAIKMIEGTV